MKSSSSSSTLRGASALCNVASVLYNVVNAVFTCVHLQMDKLPVCSMDHEEKAPLDLSH